MAKSKGLGFFVSNTKQKAIKKAKAGRIAKAKTREKAEKEENRTGFFGQHIVGGKTSKLKLGD